MSQSSSDTDNELLLFTREHQNGILRVVKDEVGVDLSGDMEPFCDSLVTPPGPVTLGQGGSASAMAAGSHHQLGGQGPRLPPSTLGSVPAVSRWPGVHRFCVTVCQWDGGPTVRQPPYVYSVATGKLYTDMMAAVPFRFSYMAVRDPRELQIRALPVYSEAQHMQTPVRRCALHRDIVHPSNIGFQCVRHVLRTEHPGASHEEQGERCSVVVPLEPLEPDTADYAVFYKFTCMNTCVGGMNRRSLMVVFTLEEKSTGAVLGRQPLEVKVCKCPRRDCRNDQNRAVGTKRKRSRAASPAATTETASSERLVVTADDEAMYQALLELRDSLRRYRRSVSSPAPPAPNKSQQ